MADKTKAEERGTPPPDQENDVQIPEMERKVSILSLTRDTISGYIFWSIFQSLLPTIWYFPQDSLGISGYETFGFLVFLPVLCAIPGVLRILRGRWCLGILRFLAVASVASFQAPNNLIRLVVLAFGSGISMMVLGATLFSPSQRIRCQTYWSLILGLFAFISSRVWFVSYVPTWWDKQSNSVIIALGLAAAADYVFSGNDEIGTEVTQLPASDVQTSWVKAGAGLGSLLFLTHWCFGEVSVITRWVVAGYPDTGPQPSVWGAPVLVCLLAGVFLSEVESVCHHVLWPVVGVVAFYALYVLPTWQGYVGGLLLGVFTMSVWPAVLNHASACRQSTTRTLTLAILVYILEIVFEVWTVAYNFVPLGEFTRERTDVLIGVDARFQRTLRYLPVFVKPGCQLSFIELAYPKEFTAAIWACRFSYDNEGWYSFGRAAEVLNNTGADVIVIIESDASKPFLGNNDLAMWMEERLGMYADFGPATKDHTWGIMLLSKFPIIKSTHHLLPSPHGELAPAITATINMSGRAVDFVVGHNGNDGDNLDRELQTKYLAEELQKCQNPAVYLGYVTSKPKTRDYWQLRNIGGVKDIDDTDMNRCLGYARISNGGLSDTEIQLGRFGIPSSLDDYYDNEVVSTDPTEVDSHVHFNPVFGKFYSGHGNFNHNAFHMNTPKYFLSECASNTTQKDTSS
ncbi:hypothetical protein BaRGS_00008109 [Batillaria attramentaria]|uniref:PGAP2-interacting protein n=1 Tax=Batillaria attramentaria TaxID=370345 RepID=A0ABD0LM98_9CAEN